MYEFILANFALTKAQYTKTYLDYLEKLQYLEYRSEILRLARLTTRVIGLFGLPNGPPDRLWRQEERKGWEDTLRSGRRAASPLAPPAFPS
jgi:hypothetical protein